MQNTQQAIFSIGNQEYGLNIMDVNIIEKYTGIEQIAKLPKNIRGMLRLRGEAIPVYSLRRKFGQEDLEPTEETRLIITTSNGLLLAFEVDGMQGIAQLTSEQILEVPPIIKSEAVSYAKSVTNLNDRLILLLDNDGILTKEEQISIKEMIAKAG